MYIIKLEASENGGRPSLQSWTGETAPEGYALCPDEFFDVFYSTTPAGFVNITVEEGVVTSMTVNQEAVDAWNDEHPILPEAQSEPEPTEMEQLRADVDYIAALTGVEL